MTRDARIAREVELATTLTAARAEVARIEGELDRLMGGAGRAETAAAPSDQPPTTASGRAKRGARLAQVVELVKQGVDDVRSIAAQLAITQDLARVTLMRARRNGLLPKARAA